MEEAGCVVAGEQARKLVTAFFKFRPRGCSWRDGLLQGSKPSSWQSAGRAIAFRLLSSPSLLLLTKHLSTEIHTRIIGTKREREMCEARLLSSLTYPGLARAGNRQRVVFHIAGWWCASVIRPLGRWVRQKVVTRCSVTETDVATCSPG